MKTLEEKIHELPPQLRQEVEDFVDFLLHKSTAERDTWYWSQEGQSRIKEALEDIEQGRVIGPFKTAKEALKALKRIRP